MFRQYRAPRTHPFSYCLYSGPAPHSVRTQVRTRRLDSDWFSFEDFKPVSSRVRPLLTRSGRTTSSTEVGPTDPTRN